MPPAKRKSNLKISKTRESVSEDSWKSEIENLSLNDAGWRCVIAMIVETRPDHARYLDLFTEAADQETRDSVFSLSHEKLIRSIKLSNKSDLRRGICHFANKKIEEEGEAALGPWLTCRLIKYFVNRAKSRNLEILQSRVRIDKGITKEIETVGNAGPKTPGKSRGGFEDVKSPEKVNTRLRKRGEEWKDRIHIDDAPLQGPNLYVLLSGFHDINLSDELLNAGLPLTAIFRVLRPEEEPDLDHPQLRTFWSSLDATLKDPRTAARYSEVVFQTFCPPEMKELELEALRTDAYRRISFLMYDLCDIKRQHASYIGKMKLQGGLEEKKPEIRDAGTYDEIMKAFPEECASVAIVLDALLSQIEGLKMMPKETFDRPEKKSSEDFGERLRSKIDHLNDRFDIFDGNRADIFQGHSDPRLILHGDDLGRKSCGGTIAEDFGVRVLKESGTFTIWKNFPVLTREIMEMHRCHIRRISNCFDVEIDDSTTEHYLHLLLFDKLVNGEYRRGNIREKDDLERKISFPSTGEVRLKANVKRTKSQAIIPDKLIAETFSFPSNLIKSDSAIEYGKNIADTFECPELFGLIDTREMLRSGFIKTQESLPVKNESARILDLEEFDTVQLLSAKVFSQLFFTCSQEFDAFETRYFPPTDSVLILFRNNRPQGDDILEMKYAASIRTPVCLRDFASFVMEEEREWLEKEDEKYRERRRLAEEETASLSFSQTRKDADDSVPLGSFYTDADFLLPNSIKGSEAREEKSRQGLIGVTETAALYTGAEFTPSAKNERAKGAGETNTAKVKTKKKKGKVINPSHKREESLETSISFPPPETIISSEDAGPHFLGYDIASHRVQVSGSTSDFISIDGTSVKVNLEEWTYGKGRLQITVKLLGNDLVLHNVLGDDIATFHFATSNGIFMGFSSALKREEKRASRGSGRSITRGNYHGGKMGRESGTPRGTWTPEMAVDPEFRASWPSGLVVETLPGDGPSEPFYIKQSYLSKGPECSGIEGERLRVFLRDGTVLVFLEDHTLRLMRSNGCIVTCTFANEDEERGKEEEDSSPASKLKNTRNSKGSVEVKTKLKSLNNSAEDEGVSGLENAVRSYRPSKIHRSVVLDPDGRLYEIYDGDKVRVLSHELVRTASDYEVGENFTRRNDGTDILIGSDGSLAVCFPDETRITTGYVIEDDLVFCEWTEEEMEGFRPAGNRNLVTGENLLEEEEEDGFVSILMTSCMEHKNYATVSYDQSKIECTLSMPGNVAVRISSDFLFSVTVVGLTTLEVKKSEIAFAGKMGRSGRGSSSSVFTLGDVSSSKKTKKPFLETTDSFGNIFSVDFEGKTSYKKSVRGCDPAKDDEEKFFTVQNHPFKSNPRSYRLFAVKRDLSAHEYLHYFERRNQEEDKTASIFFRQIGEVQPNQILCTTLTELNPITVSKAWLQSYKVKSIRPRNEDRKDLLRSTYSIPWNYLIPYGKNGRGIRDRTWNLPLKNRGDLSGPEVVIARTTQTIKNRDENMLKKLQKALGCYWKKSIKNFGEHRGLQVSCKSGHPEEERDKENWLNDFGLGRKATFEKALYFDGLLKRRDTQMLESRISNIRTSGSQDKANKEEIDWYKTCLKYQTVPPYFDYISGVCFTWVLECVDKVSETGKK